MRGHPGRVQYFSYDDASYPPFLRGFTSACRRFASTSRRTEVAEITGAGVVGGSSRRVLCSSSTQRTFASKSSSGLSKSRKAQLLKSAKSRKGKLVTPRLPKRRKEPAAMATKGAKKDLVRTHRAENNNNSALSNRHEMLDHPAVIVTREIEMMNVFLGFEQRNKYTLR
jgi:hypothetical protein